MSYKKIVGFENKKEHSINDNICPNCNHRNSTLNFPIEIEVNEGFLGLYHKRYLEYTCDKCGCIWRIEYA